jgi:hypothetical protein
MTGAAAVTAVGPALASGPHQATTAGHGAAVLALGHRPDPASVVSAGIGPASVGPTSVVPVAGPVTDRPALVAPLSWHPRLSPAGIATAVTNCVRYATGAGWANNGYYGGDLVTAATICVAESAGDPNLIVCDNASGAITGHGDYPKYTCPAGTVSYDRGLWQLNTVAASSVSNKCAFNPGCNADQAYVFSGRGTSFVPWSSYDQDSYAAPFLDRVQRGVTNLSDGTLTSAVLGECLTQARLAIGAKIVLANCGTAQSPVWLKTRGRFRERTKNWCMTIASPHGNPDVVLEKCATGKAQLKAQQWTSYGLDELRNNADGKCLTDPGARLTAGTPVDVTPCTDAKAQTWFVP